MVFIRKSAISLFLLGLVLVHLKALVGLLPSNAGNCSQGGMPAQVAAGDSFLPSSPDIQFSPNSLANGKDVSIQQLRNKKLTYVRSDRPYFACNAPKTGGTLWALFYLYVNNGIVVTKEETSKEAGVAYRLHGKALVASQMRNLNVSDAELLAMHHRTDRILFARNPYVRFLSSYQDWKSRNSTQRGDVSFAQFADWIGNGDYKHLPQFNKHPMDHIMPVTATCSFNILGYIVLRVEEQALWFNALLQRYNLTELMQEYTEKSGNAVFTSVLQSDALLSDYVPQFLGRQQFQSKYYSKHNKDSVGKLGEYYTPEIADICTRVFEADFKAFQYPLWDGNNHTFSLM